MISKKYSIIIVPEAGDQVIRKNISRWVVYSALAVMGLVVTASTYFAVGYLMTVIDRQQMESLAEENSILENKITEFETTVQDLRADMSTIIDKDDFIRLVFDLPALDSDLREVGVGGAAYPTPEINSDLGQRTWMVEEDIQKIQRQLRLENASFEELVDKVKEKKNVLDHTPTIKPCDGVLSRGFGMHNDPFTGLYQPHNGIDLAAPAGTPIHATADGIVKYAGYQSKLGNTVIIDHGYGILTYYGHMSKIRVTKGQKISRHEVVGFIGSSGYSTGPHLHYEVKIGRRSVNPYKYILSSILS